MDATRKLNATDWVKNYSDILYSYTLARVQNTAQAEDIVQETFLSGWRARETYNGLASEKNWLYAICKNKIIDYYRKAATNKEVLANENESDEYFFAEDGHWNNNNAPKYWAIDYNQPVEKKEFYSILNQCKSKLKEVQQSVFTMKYLEDANAAEICETLGISPQNYWVLIHRAKLQLRTCLEKNWINI